MNSDQTVALSELGYLRVAGADARDFLQGQLSSDLRQLRDPQAQISSYNSPKGRMLAVLHLLDDGDGVLIELHRSVLESTLQRLRLFVLRSKVTLDDVSASVRAIGLIGDAAAASLRAAALPVPDAPLTCRRDPARGLCVMRRLGALPRYSITGPAAALETLLTGLPPPQPFDRWRRADIEAGVPVVYPQTRDHFVPQMANLDQLGGISFDKGCYTGQEIVARLHYLGQLKRRLFVCHLDGPPPEPGSDVIAGDPPTSAGEIVDAVATEDGAIASAVLQLAHAQCADLRLGDGRRTRVLKAPPGEGRERSD